MFSIIRGVVGIFGPLTTLFIVLKLLGVIEWSWLWVFAPTWIYLIFIAIVSVIIKLFER